MATANEKIRDALIKRQVQMIKRSGKASAAIIAELEGAYKELRRRIDKKLAVIRRSGEITNATQIKQLLALEEEIRGILEKPFRNLSKTVRKLLEEEAVSDPRFIRDIWKDKLPVVVSFGLPSPKQLREIVNHQPIDGTPLADVLEKFEADTVDRIMAEMRRGLVLGESIPNLMRRLRNSLNISKRAAEAIARTAANAISNGARQRMFEENKDVIAKVIWVATLDDATCPRCGALDGKRYDVDKGPRPPAHRNCRCTMVASIDGDLLGRRPLKRSTQVDLLREYADQAGIKRVRSRASLPRGHKGAFDKFARKRVRELTGKTPATVTFDDFLREQSEAFQDKVLRREVANWYRKRQVDLEDLFDDNGNIYSIDEILRRRPDLRASP